VDRPTTRACTHAIIIEEIDILERMRDRKEYRRGGGIEERFLWLG
jgi:hypothetical protein